MKMIGSKQYLATPQQKEDKSFMPQGGMGCQEKNSIFVM
jgi:hypothetical protein